MKYTLLMEQIKTLMRSDEFKQELAKARLRDLRDEIAFLETYLHKSENGGKIEVNSKLAWELHNGTD